MSTSVGTIIYTVVAAVLVVAVGLAGVGFGWRKLKKYVTGKKF